MEYSPKTCSIDLNGYINADHWSKFSRKDQGDYWREWGISSDTAQPQNMTTINTVREKK